MRGYAFTDYFTESVARRRPYLRWEWCIRVIENPLRTEVQVDNRVRFWGKIDEHGGRVLRVVTLPDRATIHNVFFDGRFKP